MRGADGRSITEPAKEIFELCCEPGARIAYRNLALECLEHPNSRGLWRVERDGEYLDTINTHGFHSASEFQRWLDAAAEGEPFEACAASRSVPSD